MALTAALALTACGGESADDREAAVSAASRSSVAAASFSAAEASSEAVISSNRVTASSAAASRSAEAAASSAAAEAARKVPTVFSRSGDDVVAITKPPGVTAAAATITYNGGRNFAVKGVDIETSSSGSDLLVNEIGAYEGRVPMAPGPALVEVQAEGTWSITVD